ncbi:MAG TPA: hypothetical protein VEV81_05090, partial [Pyrinomonadaceae bacterium]|nr:hypothetical protein [Pyrinomonadaceae bacterium]
MCRLRVLAASLLLCLTSFAVNAQQGSGTAARPSPTPSGSSSGVVSSMPGPLDVHAKVDERAIDNSIPNDPAVEAVIAPYSAKVRELDAPLGKLAGELKKTGIGGGSLGNFVVDAIR